MAQYKSPQPFFSENGPRAVLLLHAYSGSSNDVRMLSRFLEKHHYTVYAPIFSGHGTLEPRDILAASVSQWQQDVQEALTFLKERGYQEIAVFGLSMGGIFAMKTLTENHPEIIGGGSFCSPLFKTKNHVPENFLLYAEKVYQAQGLSSQEVAEKVIGISQTQPTQLMEIEALGAAVAADLAAVKVPVFLAQGGQDEMIDATTVFRSGEALTQTDIVLRWYPTSGHVITVDPIHQQFEKDVLAFVSGLTWNE